MGVDDLELAVGAEVADDIPEGFWEGVRRFCDSLVPVPEEDPDVLDPDPLL
jgi:hypothetical protein